MENTENIEIKIENSKDDKQFQKNFITNCQICKIKNSIYKCPRCQIKTCCLICVKEHKKIYKCSGIKDKFSKKPLKEFTDCDFMRDMNFINSTINDTNTIGKKMFNLTDDNLENTLIEIKNSEEDIRNDSLIKRNFVKDRNLYYKIIHF